MCNVHISSAALCVRGTGAQIQMLQKDTADNLVLRGEAVWDSVFKCGLWNLTEFSSDIYSIISLICDLQLIKLPRLSFLTNKMGIFVVTIALLIAVKQATPYLGA